MVTVARADNDFSVDAATAPRLMGALKLNCAFAQFIVTYFDPSSRSYAAAQDPYERELQAKYRSPIVRSIVRMRVMVQAGRASAKGARKTQSVFYWLCARAPLWVVVHVCALLRDATYRDHYAEFADAAVMFAGDAQDTRE